jgi:diacylglycerol kinase (ATP)
VKRAVVFYNPTSGKSQGSRAAEAVCRGLDSAQWEVLQVATERAGHATELAADWGARVGLIVVVGGDGTLREAAQGLMQAGHHTPLGVIPQGHGNVIAQEFGVPLELDAAVTSLGRGEARQVDVLRVNGEIVLAMVGLGLDARIVRRIDWARHCWGLRGWYRIHGDSLYIAVGVTALLSSYSTRFRATCDGKSVGSGFRHGAVSNTRMYGKGMSLTPGADASDGLLDFALRQRSGFASSFQTLLCAKRMIEAPDSLVTAGQGKRIQIVAERGLLEWQADGDPRPPVERLEIEVVPGAFQLWVPPT